MGEDPHLKLSIWAAWPSTARARARHDTVGLEMECAMLGEWGLLAGHVRHRVPKVRLRHGPVHRAVPA
jgi:hypothetical protein